MTSRILSRTVLAIVLFGCVRSSFGQCNAYYQLDEGSAWEMENYNAKGKLTGRNKQKVISFEGNTNSFKATVNSVMYDQKDKEILHGDLEFTCDNGTMIIDMRNYVSAEQMKPFESYEFTLETENLEIPNALSVGQVLKDGSMTITTTNSPLPMTLAVAITDRKILGKEPITTPAGTFDCYKISSNLTVQTKMAVKFSLKFSTIEWLAPKVAVVKSESYKGDKLQGYSILTSVVK